MTDDPKTKLRHQYLQWRQHLSDREWQDRSQRICQHLLDHPQFQQATTVLTYVPHRREPDLRLLWSLPKQWGLPRVVGQDLQWHCFDGKEDSLQQGRYGIWQPASEAPLIEPSRVDLCLVPAVACDRQGYRLGYGAGFFDRLFAHPEWQYVCRWGIVFELALVAELPRDPWDQPLQAICTESGILEIS